MRAWLLAGAVLGLAACTRVCPHEVQLVGPDGGVATCVQPTDCPRPSNVLACTNTDDPLRGCVGCVDTKCKQYVPAECP